MDNLFGNKINKRKFIQEYSKCKEFVDNGVRDYFILSENTAYGNVSQIGNTTLKDISDVFGVEYITLFRFAFKLPRTVHGDEQQGELYQTFRIRPLSKNDRKRLRCDFKFFPSECYLCEVSDGCGYTAVYLFTQKSDGTVFYISGNPMYMKDVRRCKSGKIEGTQYGMQVKKIIETIPDYFESIFAVTEYKGVDMIIPIPYESVTRTFKDREKDSVGVKRHLIHHVKSHKRFAYDNIENVKAHLRGTSFLTIDGIDVKLMASYEWSKNKKLWNKNEHQQNGNN